MLELTVMSGPDAGRVLHIQTNSATIGRGPANDLALTDPSVSRHHGRIELRAHDMIYHDLESRLGSIVRTDRDTVAVHGTRHRGGIRVGTETTIYVGESTVRIRNGGVPKAAAGSKPVLHEIAALKARPRDTIATLATTDSRLGVALRAAQEMMDALSRADIVAALESTMRTAWPSAAAVVVRFTREETDADDGDADNGDDGDDAITQVIVEVPTMVSERLQDSADAVVFGIDDNAQDAGDAALVRSCIAAPMRTEAGTGMLYVSSTASNRAFTDDDLSLLSLLSHFAVSSLERLRLRDELERMFDGVVDLSVAAVDARDPATAGHSLRVAGIAERLAHAVDASAVGRKSAPFGATGIRELRYAALLHDYGKIGVSENTLRKGSRLHEPEYESLGVRIEAAIAQRELALEKSTCSKDRRRLQTEIKQTHNLLTVVDLLQAGSDLTEAHKLVIDTCSTHTFKQRGINSPILTESNKLNLVIEKGTLNQNEWNEMKRHAELGRELVASIPWSFDLLGVPEIVAAHHEKLDGSGYPHGLADKQIGLSTRVLTIADMYDAMTCVDRSYRRAASPDEATEALREEAERGRLDRELVDLFIDRVVPTLQPA